MALEFFKTSSYFPLPSALLTKFRPEKLSIISNFVFVIFLTFSVGILLVEQTAVENMKKSQRIPKPSGFFMSEFLTNSCY